VGQGGGGILRGPEGAVGSRFQALQNAVREGKQFTPGTTVSREAEAAAEAMRRAGGDDAAAAVLFSASMKKIADESVTAAEFQTQGAQQVRTAVRTFVDQIEEGAVQIGAGLRQLARSIFTGEELVGGAAVAGGAGAIFGGIGGLGGAASKGLGGKLFKGLNTYLLGSLGAEAIGGIVGGKAGGDISSIGGDVALGAGLGSVVPFIGTGAGALLGGAFGVASKLFGGGNDVSKAVAAQQARQKKLTADLANANFKSSGAGALEEAADNFGQELETAFGSDQKAAEGAQKSIDKAIKVASANIKLFGSGTARGRGVTQQLLPEITATVESIVKSPKTIDQSAGILETLTSSILSPAESQFQTALKRAKTLPQIVAASKQAGDTSQQLYAALFATPKKNIEGRLKTAEEELGDLSGAGQGIARLRGRQPDRGEKPLDAQGLLAQLKKPPGSIPGRNAQGQFETAADYQDSIKAYQERKDALEKRANAETEAGKRLVGVAKDISTKERQRAATNRKLAAEERALSQARGEARSSDPVIAHQQETHIDLLAQRVREYRGNAGRLNKELADAQREAAKLGTEAASQGTSNSPQVRTKMAAIQANIKNLKQLLAVLNELGPQLYAQVQQFAQEQVVNEGISTVQSIHASGNARKLAEAGPDPAAKAREQAKIDAEERRRYEQLPGVKQHGLPKSQTDKEVESRLTRRQEAASRALEHEEGEEHRALARIPGSNQGARAATQIKFAESELARVRAGYAAKKPTATSGQVEAAEIKLEELKGQRAESVASEASALISAQGALAQARDTGDAVAQANDAINTAAALVGAAKTAPERINAEASLVQAQAQLRQAQQQAIGVHTALIESGELNPLEKARTKVKGDIEEARLAKTKEEKEKARTSIKNDKQSVTASIISEAEEEGQFLLHTQQITGDALVSKLKSLLKLKNLSKAQIRQIRSQIYDIEHETAGGDLGLGNIHKPTLYDVRTAEKAGSFHTSLELQAAIPPEVFAPVTIHISGESAQANSDAVVHKLNHHFKTHSKAKRRNARLAGV
jgi:hypothetical protein